MPHPMDVGWDAELERRIDNHTREHHFECAECGETLRTADEMCDRLCPQCKEEMEAEDE